MFYKKLFSSVQNTWFSYKLLVTSFKNKDITTIGNWIVRILTYLDFSSHRLFMYFLKKFINES